MDTAAVRVAVAAVEAALAASVAAVGVPGRHRRRRPHAAQTTGRPAPNTISFGTSRNWKI